MNTEAHQLAKAEVGSLQQERYLVLPNNLDIDTVATPLWESFCYDCEQ